MENSTQGGIAMGWDFSFPDLLTNNADDARRGYISKESVLAEHTEEDIFALAFGFEPRIGQRVTSPFRDDTQPGCTFWRGRDGRLRFTDFAEGVTMDCFDAVRASWGLPSFYHALELVSGMLGSAREIHRKGTEPRCSGATTSGPNGSTEIDIWARSWCIGDRDYWQKYGIKREQLEQDGVKAVESYRITKNGARQERRFPQGPCYAYTKFFNVDGEGYSGKAKLYFPRTRGGYRFLTNCGSDIVGGLEHLEDGIGLVVTKSYKDFRVLKNHGVNAIWLQNEGMAPVHRTVYEIGKRVPRITVLFDSDEAGMKAAEKIAAEFNQFFPGRAVALWPPVEWRERHNAKDPADIHAIMGPSWLDMFLEENNLGSGRNSTGADEQSSGGEGEKLPTTVGDCTGDEPMTQASGRHCGGSDSGGATGFPVIALRRRATMSERRRLGMVAWRKDDPRTVYARYAVPARTMARGP